MVFYKFYIVLVVITFAGCSSATPRGNESKNNGYANSYEYGEERDFNELGIHISRHSGIFNTENVIRPLIALGLDLQGSMPVTRIRNVPAEWRMIKEKNWVNSHTSTEPSPLVDWRFARVGLEFRPLKHFELDVFGDASMNLSYYLRGDKNFEHETYLTSNYSPVVIPGLGVELNYIFDSGYYLFIGGRYREYEVRTEAGVYEGRYREDPSHNVAADIYERSIYFGFRKEVLANVIWVNTRLGFSFNDIEERDSRVNVDHDDIGIFLGAGLEFRL
ncbi:MAG: hypothetical protein US74_C0021G0014 [Parcubacteria group bacterium GW2011_GWA2_38_13]|nr:MAG: hypothetical protein US74_C0021G0014 [Parcubacteria group bacterium GW2011_GWA2_38_13]